MPVSSGFEVEAHSWLTRRSDALKRRCERLSRAASACVRWSALTVLMLASATMLQAAPTVFPLTTAIGSTSAPVTVTVTMSAGGKLGSVAALTQGVSGLDFAISGAGTCTTGTTYAANATCNVQVTFSPKYPGQRFGAVALYDSSSNPIGATWLAATATGPLSLFVPGIISTVAGDQYWIYTEDGIAATTAPLFLPFGVAIDAGGNLFIADSTNNRVRRVAASTQLISTVAGDGTAGQTGDNGPATSAEVSMPTSVAIDGAGNLYIADSNNDAVRMVNSAGVITTIAGTLGTHGYSGDNGAATKALLDAPDAIALDAVNGYLYIADTGNNVVRKVNLATGIITTFAGNNTAGYSGDGGQATNASLNGPWGLSVDPTGQVYIADQNNNCIRKVATNGAISTFAGTGTLGYKGDGGSATSAELDNPAATAIDPAGNVYIADSGNNVVRKVNAITGTIATIAGGSSQAFSGDGGVATGAGLNGPYAMVLDGLGDLYISDLFHNRIRVVRSANTILNYPAMRVDRVSATQTQKLENDGNATLNISLLDAALTATAPNPAINSQLDTTVTTCPVTGQLNEDLNCIIGAQFAPQVTGTPVTGYITLTSDSPTSMQELTLTGTVQTLYPPTITLTTSGTPSKTGALVTFNTTVTSTGPTPTGTVTFMDGTTALTPSKITLSSSGAATLATLTLAAGSHTITVVYSGDSNTSPATSTAITQVVTDATTTALTSNANPASTLQNVTLTATVTGNTVTPTGTVTFTDTTTGATLASGVALTATTGTSATATYMGTFTATYTTHTLKATYNAVAPSTTSSGSLTETISANGTTTGLGTSNASVAFGTPVTFTATVTVNSPGTGTPTGSVTFYDAVSTKIGTGTLNTNGVATLTLSTLSAGPHSITAVYGGDANDGTSTSAAVGESITQISTTTAVTDSSASPAAGASLTLTATITPGATATPGPSGTVTFKDGGVTLGTGTVSGSVATFATSSLATGSHTIVATYSGDTNYSGSFSSTFSLTVAAATVTGTINYSPSPVVAGKSETLTMPLTSNGGTPTGSVIFTDGSATLGTAQVSASGVATLSGLTFTPGSHTIIGSYSGDTNTQPTTAKTTFTVTAPTMTVGLVSSLTPSTAGVPFLLTATVTGNNSALTGKVDFYDAGTTLIGSSTLNSSGVGTLSVSTLAVGTHTLTAYYEGDTYNGTGTSPGITQVVVQATTTTTLSASAASEPVGAGVTFTSSVTSSTGGVPSSGSVQFMDGPTVLATVPLTTNGIVTYTTSTLIVGSHLIQANYLGDTNDATSSSPLVTFVVRPVTTIALASNQNPAPAGANVQLTAAVGGSSQTATGAVTFTDSVTGTLGSIQLNSAGVAIFNTTTLALGTHIITASYVGDTNNTQATSAPLSQSIIQATTQAALTLSSNTSTIGSSVQLTATITGNGGIPGGQVQFLDGTTLIGTGTLSANGTVTITISNLSLGAHALSVSYLGNVDNLAAVSTAQTLTIGKGAPTLTVVSSSNPVVQGLQVVFTANLSGTAAPPTGASITFSVDGTPMGSSLVEANDTATFATTTLAVGSHTIEASFAGNATDNPATSSGTPETILASTSGITLASNANPALVGTPVVFSMTVTGTGAQPGGTVKLFDGANSIGTASLDNNGYASITTSSLTLGAHTMSATYAGDASHPGSTSGQIVQSILQPTTTVLTSNNNPALSGTSIGFTVVVAGNGNPVTGTVTLRDGATSIASGPIGSAGTATFSINSLSPGQHSIVATYGGDSISQTSSSPVLVQTVQDSSTATVLSTSANPSVAGASLTLSAQVTGKGATPTGAVQFLDGTTVLGTGTVGTNGIATYSTSTLTAGQHLLIAIYQGDANTLTSTSNPVLENVDQKTTVTLAGADGSTVLTGATAAPIMIGDTVIFTVTVSGSNPASLPTGQVTLSDGSTIIGTGAVSGTGTVTFTISTLGLGSHTLTASYAGDAQNFPATSSPMTTVVQLHPSNNVLTISSSTVVANQPFSVVATLTGGAPLPPSGTVVFSAGSTTLGSAPLNASGIATLTTTLDLGSYNVIATYQGDSLYLGSVSTAVPLTVVPATNFTITLNPPTLSIASTEHQEIQLTLTSIQNFTDVIALGCVGLPKAATCTFSTDQVSLAANGTQTVNLMIDTGSPLTSGSLAKKEGTTARSLAMCFLPGGVIFGIALFRRRRGVRLLSSLLLALLFAGAMTMTGCGGININGTPAGSYTFNITAIGAKTAATQSAPMALTVTAK